MILVTYWHDDDEETITNVACNTDAEAEEICGILQEYKMDIISVDEVPNVSTPAEIRQMFKDFYGE